MSRLLPILAALAAALCLPAGARQVEPGPYSALIDRYAMACHRLSAAECEIGQPVSDADARRLACLFDELDARAGAGTAAAHVGWAENFAATGRPPAGGFPATIGEQRVLVASLLACRDGTTR